MAMIGVLLPCLDTPLQSMSSILILHIVPICGSFMQLDYTTTAFSPSFLDLLPQRRKHHHSLARLWAAVGPFGAS